MFILEKRDAAQVDNPPAGKFALFIDSTTGHFVSKDSTGAIVVLSANPIP